VKKEYIREIKEAEMKEKVSLTTMTVTYPIDDDNDLPFESADNVHPDYDVLTPEVDRFVEPECNHDWTMDYDDDEFTDRLMTDDDFYDRTVGWF
jgi:hypothetical protein